MVNFRAQTLIDSIEFQLMLYERHGDKSKLELVYKKLHELEDEINMPDWVSVITERPKYGEVVEVCHRSQPLHVWKCDCLNSKHEGFFKYLFNNEITHWRRLNHKEIKS